MRTGSSAEGAPSWREHSAGGVHWTTVETLQFCILMNHSSVRERTKLHGGNVLWRVGSEVGQAPLCPRHLCTLASFPVPWEAAVPPCSVCAKNEGRSCSGWRLAKLHPRCPSATPSPQRGRSRKPLARSAQGTARSKGGCILALHSQRVMHTLLVRHGGQFSLDALPLLYTIL